MLLAKYRVALAVGFGLFALQAREAPSHAAPENTAMTETGTSGLQGSAAAKATELAVPLKDATFNIGDVAIRIGSDNAITVNRASFLSMVARILRKEALEALNKALPQQDYVTFGDLQRAGIEVSYNSAELELSVKPKVEQRPRGEIKGNIGAGAMPAETLSKPAVLSAYLNTRLALNYDQQPLDGTESVDVPAMNLDGAMRWGSVVLEGEGGATVDGRVVRSGTRFVYDMPDQAIRVTGGDLVARSPSLQSAPPLLGVSVERSYERLQPNRNIRPTGKRSFRIERPSDVKVLVNDREVRRLQLGPGEYDLDDLPLTLGSNDIRLQIKNDLGEEQTLDFSILYNRSLLGVGVTEWSLAAGVPSYIVAAGPEYDYSEPAVLATCRRGILENLTSEVSFAANAKTGTGSISALSQTRFGLLSVDASASVDQDRGAGWQVSGEFEIGSKVLKDSASVHMGIEVTSPDYTPSLTTSTSNDRWLRLSGSYSRDFGADITGSLSAHYDASRSGQDDVFGAGVSVSRMVGDDLTIGLSGNYESTRSASFPDEPTVSVLARLNYRLGRSSRVALSYDQANHTTTSSFGTEYTQGASRFGVDAAFENDGDASVSDSPEHRLGGAVTYVDDRTEVHASRTQQFYGLGSRVASEHNSVSVGTALAFADGEVALSRPIHDSFALIDQHSSIKDNQLRVAPAGDGYRASSDKLGPTVVPDISSYSLTRLPYEVEDLPPGYDIGSGSFDIMAPYKAGYKLKVGSDAATTAGGTLLNAKGEPVALLTGTIHERDKTDKKIPVFTNDAGRFVAPGLSAGEWIVEMSDSPPTRYAISIAKDSASYVELGDMRPIQ